VLSSAPSPPSRSLFSLPSRSSISRFFY
jgi:hypothetical protein